MPDIFKGTEMEKIYKKAQIASFTDKEYNEYVSEIMYEEDRRNQLATAYHQGVAYGEAKGEARGEARGEAKGEAKGLAKGIVQGKSEDAVKMLSLGMDVELISKITGLSAEEISALGKGE